MANRPPIPYSSSEEVLLCIIENRFQMTLWQITNACAWALDRNSVERGAIVSFVRSLRPIDPTSLSSNPYDQQCSICLEKYGRVLYSDIPAQLACGHVMGAECLKKWFIRSESCPQCRREVFRRPDPPEEFTTERNLLGEILSSGTDFLTETLFEIDQSYFAFRRWASEVGQDDQSNASRRLAGECLAKLDTLAGNRWRWASRGQASFWEIVREESVVLSERPSKEGGGIVSKCSTDLAVMMKEKKQKNVSRGRGGKTREKTGGENYLVRMKRHESSEQHVSDCWIATVITQRVASRRKI